jgi:hypothetical protein
MKYPNGQEVKLGDKVQLSANRTGVVLCSFDMDEYNEAYPKSEWGYLGEGVLIDFPSYGLTHYKAPDPDLLLAARADFTR